MIRVSVDLRQWKKVSEKLVDIVQYPEKYKIFTLFVQLFFRAWWAETFRNEGARRGHAAWKPLNPTYERYKTSHSPAQRILQWYGHLLGSVSALYGPDGGIVDRQNDYVVWGTQVPYARYHQEGGTTRGKPPKREMIFVTNEDIAELERFTALYIEREL